ncbi:MAG: class C sortase [Eubacterium sp.]|nr:class C sortase [Eubacterium sp.]
MNKKKKRSSVRSTVILFVILLVGIGILLYPTFSNWWNNFHQTRAIAGYVETVANMDAEEYERMWKEAEAYNKKLLTRPNRYNMTDEQRAEYESILDVTGTGIMGYIEIPSIDVSLPIYHGTNESVLQIAIGHIESSSFPIGGIGTHAVISGHRGLPSARLFTDIDQLQSGDRFLIQVLDRTLTYEVDQIRIVLPSELQDLEIDPAQDYCTLVTCTPYGVNTHRLLVRGHRVENDVPQANVTAEAMQLEPVIVAPLIAAPMLLLLIIWLFIITSKRAKHRDALRAQRERMLEEAIRQGEENASGGEAEEQGKG